MKLAEAFLLVIVVGLLAVAIGVLAGWAAHWTVEVFEALQ